CHFHYEDKMKSPVRLLLLGLAAAAAMVAPVVAAEMTATANANVRSAPGGAVIGLVQRGERVEVDRCGGGWCELADGGFVSSSLLRSGDAPELGISIGPGGVGISIGTPQPPARRPDRDRPRPPAFEPDLAEVCFYARANFRGESF